MSKTGSVYMKNQGRQRKRWRERALIAPMETKFLQILKSAELVLDVRYWKDKRCLKLRRKSEIIS